MNADTERIVKETAREAEASRDEPMPSGSDATRPNKSIPVAVRLAPDDVATIEALANSLDIPVSTLLRGWILDALAGKREDSVATALDRVAAEVQRLRELVA